MVLRQPSASQLVSLTRASKSTLPSTQNLALLGHSVLELSEVIRVDRQVVVGIGAIQLFVSDVLAYHFSVMFT